MAEILFGSPAVRLNVNKVWRRMANPDVIHGTARERREYIQKMKEKYDINWFMRHTDGKMYHGSQKFWNYSVWVIRPVRGKMISGPDLGPYENLKAVTHDWNASDFIKKYMKDMELDDFTHLDSMDFNKFDDLDDLDDLNELDHSYYLDDFDEFDDSDDSPNFNKKS
ncbi:hypothetical protein SteCoe_18154 [Stentor coeruleus]|uniref:Uncharacterized protein n=1 Tax=Stentor coeruleus TaxID=5963 RepID=A0A1R2BXR1_9CILI|nr:hypothetical protein SteCoe_18154 [Stentor coeruleus]